MKDKAKLVNSKITKINKCYTEAIKKITDEHIGCFQGMDKPLFLISRQYPGLWMEHV